MAGARWTPESLAELHQELMVVAEEAAVTASAWPHSGGGAGPPVAGGLSTGGDGEGAGRLPSSFDLKGALREAGAQWRAGLRTRALATLGPGVVLGLLLVRAPLGFPLNWGVVVSVGGLLALYVFAVFWEALLNEMLSGKSAAARPGGFYLSGIKVKRGVVARLMVLGFAVYVGAWVWLAITILGGVMIGAAAVVLGAMGLAGAGVALGYGALVVAGERRGWAPERGLKSKAGLNVVVGFAIVAVPVVLGAAVLTFGFVAALHARGFNIHALLGMGWLLESLTVVSAYSVHVYRQMFGASVP